ncbi:MAG TPA: hypothetical protein ENJ31_07470 [Anaerolineae bacterium]|nr:hypothetical protein [Anaerolineae bacterium]
MSRPEAKVKFVNTLLSPNQVAELEQIKQHYAIQSNSDLLRFLIRKEARQLELAPQTRLPEVQ